MLVVLDEATQVVHQRLGVLVRLVLFLLLLFLPLRLLLRHLGQGRVHQAVPAQVEILKGAIGSESFEEFLQMRVGAQAVPADVEVHETPEVPKHPRDEIEARLVYLRARETEFLELGLTHSLEDLVCAYWADLAVHNAELL